MHNFQKTEVIANKQKTKKSFSSSPLPISIQILKVPQLAQN